MAVFPVTLCGSTAPPVGTHPIPVPIKWESDRRQRPQTALNQLHRSLTGVCVSIVVIEGQFAASTGARAAKKKKKTK